MRALVGLLMGILASAHMALARADADAKELNIVHTIAIKAPPDVVWAVAGDFGGIQRWAPGVESSRKPLSG